MGFAFSGYDKVWPAMDGDLGALIIDGFQKANLHAFKVWDNGFRQITTSTKPINRPDDLQGFKIRVPVSPIYVSMFKALGASPDQHQSGRDLLRPADPYRRRAGKPADRDRHHEILGGAEILSLTNHIWDGSWILCNGDTWASLPPDLQQIVTRNFDASGVDERADIAKLNASLADTMAKRGLAVNTPDAAPFRDKLRAAGFYADWKKQYGDAAFAVLERYVGQAGLTR